MFGYVDTDPGPPPAGQKKNISEAASVLPKPHEQELKTFKVKKLSTEERFSIFFSFELGVWKLS